MRRREFIAGLGSTVVPGVARAQQAAIRTIGWLDLESPQAARESIPAFQKGLAEIGYIEGRNAAVEYRYADNNPERLPALAADLVRRQVAVIVAMTTASALAAKAATQTIPVVFRVGSDPAEIGLVASFNRPAGNLTGVANLSGDITAKRLELLHDWHRRLHRSLCWLIRQSQFCSNRDEGFAVCSPCSRSARVDPQWRYRN